MAELFHVGLTVSNMARSRRFYEDLLGFRAESDLRLPGARIAELLELDPQSRIHAVYLVLGSFTLELMAFEPEVARTAQDRRFDQTGLAHLSFTVGDPDAIVAQVAAFGGRPVSSVGGAHVIRDPDGQLIELLPAAATEAIRAERTVL